jgi:DNA-binding MarR family transcriptional regulator
MPTGLELALIAPTRTVLSKALRKMRQGNTASVLRLPSQDAEERGSRRSRLRDFESLRERRDLERRHLPFLKTIADFDICCEIGFHQLAGAPLTVKQLLLLRLAPPVTVFRRLDRLCNLDVVSRTRSQRDRRVHELRLTPGALRLFASCGDGEMIDR